MNVEEVGGRRGLAELDELLRIKPNLSPLNFSHTDNLFRNTTTISERYQQTQFNYNQNRKPELGKDTKMRLVTGNK